MCYQTCREPLHLSRRLVPTPPRILRLLRRNAVLAERGADRARGDRRDRSGRRRARCHPAGVRRRAAHADRGPQLQRHHRREDVPRAAQAARPGSRRGTRIDEPVGGSEAFGPATERRLGAVRIRLDSRVVAGVPLDAQERLELCDLFDELGPSAPTLLDGWTAHDLAAHLVLREHDLVAGPCLVLPGPFERFAERRRAALAQRKDFAWLVARIRSGPPVGFFRIGWVRSLANLNEFFVHHEDVRRANSQGPRGLTPAMDAALWRNVRRGSRFLSRRLHGCGLEVEWAGTNERVTARAGGPAVRPRGGPGELLLYIFGRQPAARVQVSGPAD